MTDLIDTSDAAADAAPQPTDQLITIHLSYSGFDSSKLWLVHGAGRTLFGRVDRTGLGSDVDRESAMREAIAAALSLAAPGMSVRTTSWRLAQLTGFDMVMTARLDEATRLAVDEGLAEQHRAHRVERRRGLPRLQVGTDGSARDGIATWAWVTSDGACSGGRVAQGPQTSSTAEQFAIRRALMALLTRRQEMLREFQPITLVTDSLTTVHAIEARMAAPGADVRGDHISTIVGLIEQLRAKEHPVTVRWTRGHSGNWLNEAADRVSRFTRRSIMVGFEYTPDRLREIALDARLEHDPAMAA